MVEVFYSINLSAELAKTSNIDLIKKYNKPLLLLIGEDDAITPMGNSKELFDMSPSLVKVLAVIPNTEHGETMKKEKWKKKKQSSHIKDLLVSWFVAATINPLHTGTGQQSVTNYLGILSDVVVRLTSSLKRGSLFYGPII